MREVMNCPPVLGRVESQPSMTSINPQSAFRNPQ